MKRIFSILLALMLCIALAVPALAADAPLLYDGADLLTERQEYALLRRLEEVRDEYRVDVVIATVDSTGSYYVDDYVEELYDQLGYGQGPNHDGVILLISMEDRDYRILSNGLAADAITHDEIYDIGDEIVPDLSDGDYADAFADFIELCVYEIDGEINGFPFEFGKSLLISLGIGLVVALIAVIVMGSQLRSVHARNTAGEYTRPGSMHLTRSGDLFLYRTVDRRHRPKESSGSSGRSGGSRNVGGGKF